MEKQNWFKKNALWAIPLFIVVVSIVLNWNDIARGFNDGWNSAK
jgi:hypothetical protein